MQARSGTFSVSCPQRQIAILGRRIEQGMSCEVDQYQVILPGANQAEFTQLALYLVACRCFACKIDHIPWTPTPAFGVNQQFVKGLGISLGKGQGNKMSRIIVVIYANYYRVTLCHFVPL